MVFHGEARRRCHRAFSELSYHRGQSLGAFADQQAAHAKEENHLRRQAFALCGPSRALETGSMNAIDFPTATNRNRVVARSKSQWVPNVRRPPPRARLPPVPLVTIRMFLSFAPHYTFGPRQHPPPWVLLEVAEKDVEEKEG